MTLEEMRQKRAALIEQAKAILKDGDKDRDITDEQRAEADKLMDEADGLKAQIETATADEQRAARLAEAEKELDKPEARQVKPKDGPITGQPQGSLDVRDNAEIRISVPHGRLTAFTGPTAERDAYYAGMWLRAQVLPGDYSSEMTAVRDEARTWCKEHVETRAAQTGQDNQYGGATVFGGFRQTMIDLVEKSGVARQYCDKWPMTSDTLYVPKKIGSVTMYFPGDVDATTASRLGFTGVTLTAKEMSALVQLPISLAQDSVIDFANRVATDMASATTAKEDDCLFNGTGASTYGGIVGIRTKMVDGNHTGSYNDATAGDDQWGEYLVGDLQAMLGETPEYDNVTQNEVWFCSKIAYAQTMLRLAQAQGGATSTELIQGVPRKQFLGYDVVTTPKMPAATTAYNELVTFLFGDMSLAVSMGVRNDFSVRQSDQRYFEYRQLGILCTERFDIVCHTVTAPDDSTAAGPIFGLRGNTS